MHKDLEEFDLDGILAHYPHIRDFIVLEWGTMRLKNYFDSLLNDTRDGARKGFPKEVSQLLITLSLKNIAHLESCGIIFNDFADTEFGVSKWELPKNF